MNKDSLGHYRNEEVLLGDGKKIVYSIPLANNFVIETSQTGKGINTLGFNVTPFGNLIINDTLGWSHQEIEKSLIKLLKESYFASKEEIIEDVLNPSEDLWKKDLAHQMSLGLNLSNEVIFNDGSGYICLCYYDETKALELKKMIKYKIIISLDVDKDMILNTIKQNTPKSLDVLSKYVSLVEKRVITARVKESYESL